MDRSDTEEHLVNQVGLTWYARHPEQRLWIQTAKGNIAFSPYGLSTFSTRSLITR